MGFDFGTVKRKNNASVFADDIRRNYLEEIKACHKEWYIALSYNNIHNCDLVFNAVHIDIDKNNRLCYSIDLLQDLLSSAFIHTKAYLIDPYYIENIAKEKSIFKCSDSEAKTCIICAYGNIDNNYLAGDKFVNKLYDIDIIADNIVFQLSYNSPETIMHLYEWVLKDDKKHPGKRTYTFVVDEYVIGHYYCYDTFTFDDKKYKLWHAYKNHVENMSIRYNIKKSIYRCHNCNNMIKKLLLKLGLIKTPNIKFSKYYAISAITNKDWL